MQQNCSSATTQRYTERYPHLAPDRYKSATGRPLAVDANEQVELAFGSLHLGNFDVEEADRIAFEALPLRFVACDVRQVGDAVPLQATMKR